MEYFAWIWNKWRWVALNCNEFQNFQPTSINKRNDFADLIPCLRMVFPIYGMRVSSQFFFFLRKRKSVSTKKIQMSSDSYILGKGIVEHLSSDRSSSVAANSKLLYFDCVTLAQCFCRLRVIANVHTLTQNIYIHTYVLYIYSALLCCSCYTNSLIYLITYNMTDNLYRSIIHVNTLAIAFYAGGKKVAIQILGSLVYGYNLHKHM